MRIKITGQFGYQAYPLTDDMIEVSETDLKQIGVTKCFSDDLKSVVPYTPPVDNSIRIGELKSKLAQSDYKLFKYMEGDLTREEYIPIMKQRKEWRAEINRLEEETEPSMAEPIM